MHGGIVALGLVQVGQFQIHFGFDFDYIFVMLFMFTKLQENLGMCSTNVRLNKEFPVL